MCAVAVTILVVSLVDCISLIKEGFNGGTYMGGCSQ